MTIIIKPAGIFMSGPHRIAPDHCSLERKLDEIIDQDHSESKRDHSELS